jgi:hypothetical protein
MFAYFCKLKLPPAGFNINPTQAPLNIHWYCGGLFTQVVRNGDMSSPSVVGESPLCGAIALDDDGITP